VHGRDLAVCFAHRRVIATLRTAGSAVQLEHAVSVTPSSAIWRIYATTSSFGCKSSIASHKSMEDAMVIKWMIIIYYVDEKE
jgi:hypothetical protein